MKFSQLGLVSPRKTLPKFSPKKISKFLTRGIFFGVFFGVSRAQITISDITVTNGILQNGNFQIVQGETPNLRLTLRNTSPDDISTTNLPADSVNCSRNDDNNETRNLYSSPPIASLTIRAETELPLRNLRLGNFISQSPGQKNISCSIDIPNFWNDTRNFTLQVLDAELGNSRFDAALNRSVAPIQENLEIVNLAPGEQGIINFAIRNVINIGIPIVIVVAVILTIIGFYGFFFSEDQEQISKGVRTMIRGVLGIIIMVSAQFMADTIMGGLLQDGELQNFSGAEFVGSFYDSIVYPLLRILSYIVIGGLFLNLVVQTFTYVTSLSDETQKKAINVITFSIFAILIILGSSEIVERVYGQRETVIAQATQNISELGAPILSTNLLFLYKVINRVLGISAFVIVTIIILQGYQLLTNPQSEDRIDKIKKTLLYIAIGLVIIVTGYLLTNFVILTPSV